MRCSITESNSNRNTGAVDGDCSHDAQHIISNALSDRSKTIYFHYWKNYVNFCSKNNSKLSLSVTPIILVNFLASLITDQHYRVNTVASHA